MGRKYLKWRESVAWIDYLGRRLKDVHDFSAEQMAEARMSWGSSFRAAETELRREFPDETEWFDVP